MASQAHSNGGRIYQRGKKWYAACYVNGIEKVKRGGNKSEALRALKGLQRERDEGQDYIPLREILDAYGECIADTRKKNTMRSFREGEKILLEWFGGDFCVHDLTRNALNKLLAHRRDSKPKPRAPITANKPCKVLRAALHYAVADNKLKGMPCKIPTLTETKKQPRILTKREFMRVRDACKHGGARLALILAYQAGLRHDEIVHLRVRDFRPCPQAEGTYTIDVTAHDGWTPKAHAERSVDLPESTIHEIASYVFTEHPFYDDPDAPLICWGVTKPRRYRDLYVPVREAFQAAGLHRKEDKSGLHMLRRSFASHLLSGGMDLKTVMAMGGWSTIEAVERYLATTDVLRRRAARILELD